MDFFCLPKDSIEIICDHLDFSDLKSISETCIFLEDISWRYRREMSYITMDEILSEDVADVLRNTNKIFKSVTIKTREDALLKMIIDQIVHSSEVSIKIDVDIESEHSNFPPLLVKFKHLIKKVSVYLYGTLEYIKSLEELKSPKPRINVITEDIETPTNFNQFNCFYNVRISKMDNLEFPEDIYNVTRVDVYEPNYDILRFKNLTESNVCTNDCNLMENLIETNKNTLINMRIRYVKDWIYKIPCQLKKLSLTCRKIGDSYGIFELINDQKHLRSLDFSYICVTYQISFILCKNKMLTSIQFNDCILEEPNVFFRSIGNTKLDHCIIQLR